MGLYQNVFVMGRLLQNVMFQSHPNLSHQFSKVNYGLFLNEASFLCPSISLLTQRFTYVSQKRIEETMLKMLPKQLAKLEKLKPARTHNTVKVNSALYRSPKTLNPNVLRREHTVSAVLLRELQETVDSGQVGEEVEKLRVIFSSVLMKGKYSCTVTWKSQGMALDQVIYDTLTRHAAAIRHVIMHSHVVGVIPQFKFAIDTAIEGQYKVDEILASGDFDMGEREEERSECANVKPERKKKVSETTSTDPTYELFQVDRESLRKKIIDSKSSFSMKKEATFSTNEESR